ncbi:MAG: hypothetical protein R3B47_07940 [Bacteroidia bacterium]
MDLNDQDSVNEARIYVRYGNGNQTNTLQKPFVLVEGFDLDLNPYDDKFGFLEWSTFVAGLSFDENGKSTRQNLADLKALADSLYDNGYDAIMVDFKDGAGDMFKNGNALVKIIQWINYTKTTDEQLIVMGASMGGLLSRYALLKMELMECDHCTKLYGTFDSPHKGANVPLSLQYAVDFYRSRGIADAEAGYQALGKPAAQQMLIHNIYPGSASYRSQWQNWLDNHGHPTTPKKIAITNGHPEGQDAFSAGSMVYSFNYVRGGVSMAHAKLWSSVGGMLTFEGLIPRGRWKISKWTNRLLKLKSGRHFTQVPSPTGYTYYDHRAGSQANWLTLLVDAISQSKDIDPSKGTFTEYKPRDLFTTFVPTYSSLDFTTVNLNPDLKSMYPTQVSRNSPDPGTHPFDAIFFHSSTVSGKTGNQQHVLVDADPGQNVDWIIDQIKSVQAINYPTTNLTSTYNLHGEMNITTYLDPIEINNSGLFQLNGDYQLYFGDPGDPGQTG